LGIVIVGSGGAIPAITTGANAGLVWNEPAAWHVDAVRVMSNVRKQLRLMCKLPHVELAQTISEDARIQK
jgi:hypothetical protein